MPTTKRQRLRWEAEREALACRGQEVSEDETVEVDMSGFVATQEMLDAQAVVDSAYVALGQELKKVYDVLDDEAWLPSAGLWTD